MAENDKNKNDGSESGAGRRFRLPSVLTEPIQLPTKSKPQAPRDVQKRAEELGIKLPPAVNQDVIANANRVYGDVRASVIPQDEVETFVPQPEPNIAYSDPVPPLPETDGAALAGQDGDAEESILKGASTDAGEAGQKPMNGVPTHDIEAVYQEIEQLREGMEEMYRVMIEMQERGDAQDKVFNTLHSELQDYKNDFIYEHLKPVVRPLLFLFDHMEQFDNELAAQRTVPRNDERRLLAPDLVRENISFFRDQLVEALRICEVTPMKRPEGEFDPRLHKVVDVVQTDAANHNVIQRIVRSGWYLNGRVFRHAEVVIGHNKDKSGGAPPPPITRSQPLKR